MLSQEGLASLRHLLETGTFYHTIPDIYCQDFVIDLKKMLNLRGGWDAC